MKENKEIKVIKLQELDNIQIVNRDGQPATLENIVFWIKGKRVREAEKLAELTGDTSEMGKLINDMDSLISSLVSSASCLLKDKRVIDDPEGEEAQYRKELSKVVKENIKRKENGATMEELLQAPLTPLEKDFIRWQEEHEAGEPEPKNFFNEDPGQGSLPDIVDKMFTQRTDQALELIELGGNDTLLKNLKEEIQKLSDNLAQHFGYVDALLKGK
jgi:hypothetical protein